MEAATYKGQVLTFRVPQDNKEDEGERLSSSLRIPSNGPEYVHVRHKVLPNGEVENLNNQKDVEGAVQKGGYDAVHYLDFTGDGWDFKPGEPILTAFCLIGQEI